MKAKRFGDGLRRGHRITQIGLLVLMIVIGAKARCVAQDRPVNLELYACSYSDQVFGIDKALMLKRAPTHFRLMTSRYVQMVQAARGYNCRGTVTVGFNGHEYMQAGLNDDPGLAWLIPTISSWMGMSLADAFDLTAFTLIFLGVLIGYAGFRKLYPDQQAAWLGAAVFLCIGLVEAEVADVYIFQVSPLIAGIPWLIHFGLSRKLAGLYLSAGLLAFCCSWCSLVRMFTSLICMVFLTTFLVFRLRPQKLFLPLLLVALACIPSVLFARRMIARRNMTLASVGKTPTAVDYHTIWHSIYIGFAFVPNSQVPAYVDAVASDKVRSIDPTVAFASAKYELILRQEVFNLATRRPMLLLENLAAKAGILMLLASILLFPSRRLLFAERKVLWMDAAFVAAIAVSSMSVILVVPKPAYLLTFFCLTLLYSSVKLCRGRLLSP